MTKTPLHTEEPTERAPLELTFEETEALLQRAVEEKGEQTVYQSPSPGIGCVYFNPEDTCPSCLVGHVLAYKGVTHGEMANLHLNVSADVNDLIEANFLKVDKNTAALLTLAQSHQDAGMSWGSAVREARDEYEELVAEWEERDTEYPDDSPF